MEYIPFTIGIVVKAKPHKKYVPHFHIRRNLIKIIKSFWYLSFQILLSWYNIQEDLYYARLIYFELMTYFSSKEIYSNEITNILYYFQLKQLSSILLSSQFVPALLLIEIMITELFNNINQNITDQDETKFTLNVFYCIPNPHVFFLRYISWILYSYSRYCHCQEFCPREEQQNGRI